MKVARNVGAREVWVGTRNAGSRVPIMIRFEGRQESCQLVEMHQSSSKMVMKCLLRGIHSKRRQRTQKWRRDLRQMAARKRGRIFKILRAKMNERYEGSSSKADRSDIFPQMGGQNF